MPLNDVDNERTVRAICLGPVRNSQGGCKFLNLNTGRSMKWKQWTLLPIPDNVISQINNMGKQQKQKSDLTVTNCNGNLIATDPATAAWLAGVGGNNLDDDTSINN
eukprot:9817495-Ditylum_brightwellii.AAC.1